MAQESVTSSIEHAISRRSSAAKRTCYSRAGDGPRLRSPMAIRLVVFDLDGTLIDSRRDLADSVNALLVELGAAPLDLDAVTAMVGEGAAALVRRALAAAGIPADTPGALDRFLAHYDERMTVHTRPYAGIPETLDELRSHGLTLAVLTNKPQRASVTILERLDLSRWFFQVIGGDSAAGRKPDPAGLMSIAKTARAAGRSMRAADESESTANRQSRRSR